MERKACVAVAAALLVGVVLALAGDVKAAGAAHGTGVPPPPPPTTTKKLEEEAAPAGDVGVHRRVLSSTNLRNSVFNPDKPACIGSCGAAGRPYTSRGCKNVYRCAG